MLKKIIFILLLLNFTNVYSLVPESPIQSQNFSLDNKSKYGWLPSIENLNFGFIYLTDDAMRFISETELKKYFNIKIRKTFNDIKISNKVDVNDNDNDISIQVELYKYNKTSEIYYGVISYKISYSITQEFGAEFTENNKYKEYERTLPIAGSDSQIKQFIKDDIDNFIENLADDYYYMKDLF